MKVKPLQYDPSQPDAEQFDKLERSQELVNLTTIIKALDPPYVLAIDSDWGTGKTTFIRMWENRLKSEKYSTLFFNAWENDFVDDPMVAFISELDGGIKIILNDLPDNKNLRSKAITALEATTRFGIKILPALARAGTGAITNWTIGEKTGEEVREIISSTTEALTQEWVKKYQNNKNIILEFKEKLEGLVKALNEARGDDANKPLIFFVDELDRCRPPFAIQLLERIKHFFSVGGIIFVLAIDKRQIEHSVRGVYGSGINVDGYLRRFIDFDYRLKKPDAKKYIYFLFQEFGIDKALIDKFQRGGFLQLLPILKDILTELSDIFGLSLREQEQLCLRFNLIIRTISPHREFPWTVISTLLVLSIKDYRLYAEMKNGDISPTVALEKIKKALKETDYLGVYDWIGEFETNVLWATTNQNELISRVNKFKKQEANGILSPDNKREDCINRLLEKGFGRTGKVDLSNSFDWIELVERIQWA